MLIHISQYLLRNNALNIKTRPILTNFLQLKALVAVTPTLKRKLSKSVHFVRNISEIYSTQPEMSYSNSSLQPPGKAGPGGRGKYCCIPLCGSAQYDNDRNKTNIALFAFPNKEKKPDVYKAWCKEISKYRRKGGCDNFEITRNTKVCEFHFKPEEIKVSLGRGIKTLKTGHEIPSVFIFNEERQVKKRKSPTNRVAVSSPSMKETDDDIDMDFDQEEPLVFEDLLADDDSCEICNEYSFQIKIVQQKLQISEQKVKNLEEHILDLKKQNNSLSDRLFTSENYMKNDKLFESATGIGKEKFIILYEYLDPGENCENIKYYQKSKTCTEEKLPDDPLSSPSFQCKESKPGRRPKMKAIEQLFMFLTWLRLGFTLQHTAWLFNTPKSTVSRYLITWSNFMYFKLGCIPIWPSKQELQETMPQSFKDTYPTTKCIIDCTELFCQRPSSLAIQSSLFSHYKHHVTYKGLVGIAPSGAITFVGELFDGSISDVEIVKRSGILQKEFWEDGDSVMADRGFTIADLLSPMGVSLNIPSFLRGKDQLSHEEVRESQTIASVRIHVERAIQRIKKFRQIRNEIPLVLHGSVNQIWTISCLLCNFMNPLIKQE